MKSKILSIFFILIIGPTVFTCGTCDDPVPPPYFEIIDIESFNMKFTNSGSNSWEILAEDESIKWSNYFTRFGFEMNFIAELPRNFGATILATSCAEYGELGDKIGVDTIIVKTVYDYSEKFLAGAVINDIILTNTFTLKTNEFVPLSTYLTNNSEGVREQTFELKLTEGPTTSRDFAFDITYILNSGEEFNHKTSTIKLIK